MKVAIIVPVYKVESYLNKCVDSILAQTFGDFELVLVDDGSPDRCGEICDEYARRDSRVKVIHQANGGLSAARNAGIDWVTKNSAAEYITFVDSDDWVDSDYVERLLEGVSLGADVSCTSFARVYESGSIDNGMPDRGWHVLAPEQFWVRPNGAKDVSVAKLYSTKLFDGVRYPIGKTNEDMFTTYKLLFSANKVAYRDVPTYKYLKRTNSITTSGEYKNKIAVVEALEGQFAYFTSQSFSAAAEYARGRIMGWKLFVVNLTADDNTEKVNLRRQLNEQLRSAPLPFWANRDVYRQLRPFRFWLQWPFAMILNAMTCGRESWLLREFIPTLRMVRLEHSNG